MPKSTSMSHQVPTAAGSRAVLPTTCPGVLDLYCVPSHLLPPPGPYQKRMGEDGSKLSVFAAAGRDPCWMVQVRGSAGKASSQLLKVGCLKSCSSLLLVKKETVN